MGKVLNFLIFALCRTGYQDEQIYAKVDDMTYYPVNSMLVNTNSTMGGGGGNNASAATGTGTVGSSSAGGVTGVSLASDSPALPGLPPGAAAKAAAGNLTSSSGGGGGGTVGRLQRHHGSSSASSSSDFNAFGTVHRSQKIYL